MKNEFLIDTHTFIWLIEDDPKLPDSSKRLIDDLNNDIFISIASLWEMAIKISIGKLKLAGVLAQAIDELYARNIKILPIDSLHILRVQSLPFHHKDPFDRIIIAQSLTENITLISIDGAFDSYGIKRLF
jgi:PIN domain nuclease of toxin-antitoxin system